MAEKLDPETVEAAVTSHFARKGLQPGESSRLADVWAAFEAFAATPLTHEGRLAESDFVLVEAYGDPEADGGELQQLLAFSRIVGVPDEHGDVEQELMIHCEVTLLDGLDPAWVADLIGPGAGQADSEGGLDGDPEPNEFASLEAAQAMVSSALPNAWSAPAANCRHEIETYYR